MLRLHQWQRGTGIPCLLQSITWLYQAVFVTISTQTMWDTWEGSKWKKRECKSTTICIVSNSTASAGASTRDGYDVIEVRKSGITALF